ncbi:MAG TPA: hypothetical protein VNO30_27025 [Kofleriaceae bacterium]|nr:hypothetical protein [Kofleriaceae bacterium]
MQSGREDFIKQLRSAFPAEPIHGDAAFAQWGGSYPDAVPYEQAIDGKTWEQLDRGYILRRNDALGFLSTQQLVQILPVYLLSIVEDGVMSPALDAVLVKLTRPTRAPAGNALMHSSPRSMDLNVPRSRLRCTCSPNKTLTDPQDALHSSQSTTSGRSTCEPHDPAYIPRDARDRVNRCHGGQAVRLPGSSEEQGLREHPLQRLQIYLPFAASACPRVV